MSDPGTVRGPQQVWVATIDAATCPVCMGLHGQLFPADAGPFPPLHPRCRCRRQDLPAQVDKQPRPRKGPVDQPDHVRPLPPREKWRNRRRRRPREEDTEESIIRLEAEVRGGVLRGRELIDALLRIRRWRSTHP